MNPDLLIELVDHDGQVMREWRVPLEELPPNCNAALAWRVRVSVVARARVLLEQGIAAFPDEVRR